MYKLTQYDFVIRMADNASIPKDISNVDYQNYLAWLRDGNTPNAADTPIKNPQVTMRQARLALLQAGLLAAVEAHITTTEQQIWWEYSPFVDKSNPMVEAVTGALGLSVEQVDDLFTLAATL